MNSYGSLLSAFNTSLEKERARAQQIHRRLSLMHAGDLVDLVPLFLRFSAYSYRKRLGDTCATARASDGLLADESMRLF